MARTKGREVDALHHREVQPGAWQSWRPGPCAPAPGPNIPWGPETEKPAACRRSPSAGPVPPGRPGAIARALPTLVGSPT